ncbi:MAG: hypothetical protein WDM86_06510 [Rhizomicrobium sp.]
MNWKRGLFRAWIVLSALGILIVGYMQNVPLAMHAIYIGAPSAVEYQLALKPSGDWAGCYFARQDHLVPGNPNDCGPEPKGVPRPQMTRDVAVASLITFAEEALSGILLLGMVFLGITWTIGGFRDLS